MSACGHCWHPTGSTLARSNGGTRYVQCCHCGAPGAQEYTIRKEHVSGHGPHYTRSETVYGPIIVGPAHTTVGSGTVYLSGDAP